MRLTILLIAISSACYAQEFKKIRVGFGYGRAFSWPILPIYGEQRTSSSVFYFEPSYRITDRIAVSIKAEGGQEGIFMIGGGGFRVASWALTGQYYFSDQRFRPFVKMGIGSYQVAYGSSFNGYRSFEIPRITSIGFAPAIGFDLGHLTLMIDYHFIPTKTVLLTQRTYYEAGVQSVDYQNVDINGSYASIKLGMNIFGGRKK